MLLLTFVTIFVTQSSLAQETSTSTDNATLYWTSQDNSGKVASIVSGKINETGIYDLSVVVEAPFESESEFLAMTSDAHRNLLFYTNYGQNYIGIHDLTRNITRTEYNGMARGIENMAYDRVSTDLYWSDSTMNWIMASDTTTFYHFTPIYRSEDTIYAIAIHYKLRRLYFSSYKEDSKIITTDLAGENERIILLLPGVRAVSGMTIDYEQDRLYWGEYDVVVAYIVSSRMDGSDKKLHHQTTEAVFGRIATFSDYLYVENTLSWYRSGTFSYNFWILSKHSSNAHQYATTSVAQGITVISDKDRLPYEVSSDGECSSMPPCDHICLPRINATRQCACSLGYQKIGDTSCIPRITEDNLDDFLLVSDSAQQRIFKIPLNYNESDYSIAVAPENSRNVAAVAVNIQSQTLYWSNNETGELTELSSNGSNLIKHDTNHTVKSIVADPRTGNIFFVDSSLQRIYVMSADGRYKKAIMIPTDTEAQSIRIQMVAQDYVNRKIYWSDSGMGQVWRMDLDGMNKEIVFENLNSPQAITIDHKRGSLFLLESRDAIIYEVPLTSIHVIGNTTIQGQRYQLPPNSWDFKSIPFDIKVHDDELYLVDQARNSLERFNLTVGSSSKEKFGPPDFFTLSSLAISSTNYYETYIANTISPCETTSECRHICVDKSDSLYSCLCDDATDERECLNDTESTTSYVIQTTDIQTTEHVTEQTSSILQTEANKQETTSCETTKSCGVETTNIQTTVQVPITEQSTSSLQTEANQLETTSSGVGSATWKRLSGIGVFAFWVIIILCLT